MPTSRVAKRPDAVSLAVVLTHLALVFAPVYVTAALGGGWWILPCWLWYGLTMNGLLNLMHEAAHYHVFRSRAANNFVGRWVLGPLALADFDSYRQRHWDHHRHLGDPDDPKTTYHMDIRGRRLLTLAGRCLGLIEAVRKFRHQADAHDDEPVPGQSLEWTLRVFLVHALFGGSILALAARAHRGEPAVGTLTRLFFGAYGFGEHATHHRLPAVPYYRLTPVTETLAAKDPAMAQVNGYVGTIISLVRQTGSSPSLLPEDPAT